MSAGGPCVLVASDNASDADLVKRLLVKDFAQVVTTVVEEKAAADFVVKPFDRDTLLAKVGRLSGLSPAARKSHG